MSVLSMRAQILCSCLILSIGVMLWAIPRSAHAVGTAADAMCLPNLDYTRPCKMPPDQTHPLVGGLSCPCVDTTNTGVTTGICIQANKCQGQSTSAGGASMNLGDLSGLLQMAQKMLQSMGGGGGGGGSGSGSGGSGSGGLGDYAAYGGSTPGVGYCAQYYQVTVPSSDPCAVYTPSVSGDLTGSAASDLSSSLLGDVNSSATNLNTSLNQGTTDTASNTVTPTPTPTLAAATTASTTTVFVGGPVALPAGLSGDIRYSDTRVTVLVNDVDTKSGTQVAGFYGVPANGAPQGVIGQLCSSRPWTANFISFIVPASFFDSLCTLRGYKVGAPNPTPVPVTTTVKSTPKPTAKPTVTPTPVPTPTIPPKADIWATPASVSLGARTTVFWNAVGVTSCTETSPDGSFSQTTLSGGAATVPLSGPTTYTISCLTPSGDHITNYVTVNLSTN